VIGPAFAVAGQADQAEVQAAARLDTNHRDDSGRGATCALGVPGDGGEREV
jgi:hypothetical protein